MRSTATAARCQDCRQLVIAAISTDARETLCDVIPLTRAGELAANLAGRRTMRTMMSLSMTIHSVIS